MRKRWLIFAAAGGLGFVLLAWALHRPLLIEIGELLVYEKAGFEKVDAAVVLPGSVPDRALGALDLVLGSRAEVVLLGRDRASNEVDLLATLGIERKKDYQVNQEILIRLGVPEDRVELLPAESGSTKEDALALRNYLEHSNVKSVAIVTCKYHSYRAYLNFRQRLQGTGVEIYSFPSPHCGFDTHSWWTRRDQAKTVYLELGKLIAYGLGIS